MIIRIALSLLLILAARPAEAGRYLSAIAVAVGSTAGGTPAPAPTPNPSGLCDNCNGTGKLGDGTVFVPCPVCGGDGIKGEPPAKPAQPAVTTSSPSPPAIRHPAGPATVLSKKTSPYTRSYPIRGGWWSGCPNWRHLTTGEHRGQFDPAWLQTLSNAEVQSLHSDAHEGRVKWSYAVRPAGSTTVTLSPTRVYRGSSNCPGGNCPNTNMRGGLFSRFGRR